VHRHSWLNVILLVSVIASLVLGGSGVASAQTGNPPNGTSPKIEQQAAMQQAMQGPQPPNVKGNGQMRTMTEAQRLAARFNQAPQQRWVNKTFAGINPATAALSPLATQAMAAQALAAQSAKAKATLPKSLTTLKAGPVQLAAMSAPPCAAGCLRCRQLRQQPAADDHRGKRAADDRFDRESADRTAV
jgi:hypothetical protein